MHPVHLPDQNLVHFVRNYTDPKSLCKRVCWPGRWEMASVSTGNPICVACLRIMNP